MLDAFNAVFENLAEDGQARVDRTPHGVRLEINSTHLFTSGAAQVNPQIKPMLMQVAVAIQDVDLRNFVVEVEGHTDDSPLPSGARYASNWELSTARATGVVRFLEESGVERGRLKASGLADTQPSLPNRDEFGQAIPDNQAANRRVVILVERPH